MNDKKLKNVYICSLCLLLICTTIITLYFTVLNSGQLIVREEFQSKLGINGQIDASHSGIPQECLDVCPFSLLNCTEWNDCTFDNRDVCTELIFCKPDQNGRSHIFKVKPKLGYSDRLFMFQNFAIMSILLMWICFYQKIVLDLWRLKSESRKRWKCIRALQKAFKDMREIPESKTFQYQNPQIFGATNEKSNQTEHPQDIQIMK